MADNIQLGKPVSTKRLELAEDIARASLTVDGKYHTHNSALNVLAKSKGKSLLSSDDMKEVALEYASFILKIYEKLTP
jgi:hypothetical protein